MRWADIFTKALEPDLLDVALEEFSSDTFFNKSGDFGCFDYCAMDFFQLLLYEILAACRLWDN